MFRHELEKDLRDVFGFKNVRLTGVDDETECIYFDPTSIVSTPIVGSGKTHFRVYGTLGLNQDEANGKFGYLHHKLRTTNAEHRKRFQVQGDEEGRLVDLYDQHRILSLLNVVWEADIPWNQAPEIEGGNIYLDEGQFKIDKIDEYLFKTVIKNHNIDENYVLDYFESKYHNTSSEENLRIGGCSSVKVSSIYGRNYDWYYDNKATVVVRTIGEDGKHSSIGVCASVLDSSDLESGDWKEHMKLIPYMMLDGVNDCGVFCNINVVPAGDKGKTTGTNAELPGKFIPVTAIPRIVLDRFSTAEEAVRWISEEAKIYGLYNFAIEQECHFMIGDKNNVYAVEFVNNSAVIIDIKNNPFLTNFYMDGVEFDENGHVDVNTVTPYGSGLERFNILVDRKEDIKDVKSLRNILNELKYTNAYDFDKEPEYIWKTEFASPYADDGSTIFPNLTAQDDISKYVECGILNYVSDLFEHRDRRTAETWQTVSSSVYDLNNLTLSLVVQESDKEYNFTID